MSEVLEELPDLDFGEIHGYVPDECCDKQPEEADTRVWSQFRLFGVPGATNKCGDYRTFTVNLHRDGSWTITWGNGEPLTEEEIKKYCVQISGAQQKLLNELRWFENGKGYGDWPILEGNYKRDNKASKDDENTEYRPAGNSAKGNTYDEDYQQVFQNCRVSGDVKIPPS